MRADSKRNYEALVRMVERDSPYELPADALDRDTQDLFEMVHEELARQHSRIKNRYYALDGTGIINLSYLDHYLLLCFRFGHALHKNGIKAELADAVYYSGRMRTACDIYFKSEIGPYFLPSHPIGTIIDSRAVYGRGLRLYNAVHIGPYSIAGKPPSEWTHPVFGDGVIIYAKASVYGSSVIGNNVTITPGTTIINETIPDDCIVFGSSPELKAMPNKHNNLDFIEE
jgi:serine O-acetyltransferase